MTSCDCDSCNARTPHRPGSCRRKGYWFASFHVVDNCVENSDARVLCRQCFDARIEIANATMAWGMDGTRSPLCQGCHKPIVKMSQHLEDITKVPT